MLPLIPRYPISLFLFAVLLFSGCGDEGSDKDVLRMAIVPKGSNHEFWLTVQKGARVAEAEMQARGLPVRVLWESPPGEDDRDQQILIVENFIADAVDGLILAPIDARALVAPVELAAQVGIPTIVIDSPLDSPLPISTIGTNNYAAGQLAAREMGRILGESGRVGILRYQAGSSSTRQRENGFLETLRQEFPGISVISEDIQAGPTKDTAFVAGQTLLSRVGPRLNGIFTPNESTTAGMLLALAESPHERDQIQLVGFDTNNFLLRALKEGQIQALIVQDPYRMGYEAVYFLFEHLRGGEVPPRRDTGVQRLTRDDLSSPPDNSFPALPEGPGRD